MSLLKTLIAEHEKSIIEKCLKDNDGNRSRTAAALGISRRGLLNKLKAHGLVESRDNSGTLPGRHVP